MAARDVLFIGVFVFALATVLFTSHFIFNTMIDSIVATAVVANSSASVEAFEGTASLTNKFDYLLLGVFIALSIGLIITGWFIGGNPIYMIMYFIVVVVGVVAGGVLSWFWGQFSQASVFATTLTSFPITDHLVTNLHIYVAVLGVIGMIVMFAKPSFSSGEGY